MAEGPYVVAKQEQHVYHHSDSDGPRVNVKVESNSRGFNYEATVTGAVSVEQAISMLKDAETKLQELYGKKPEAEKATTITVSGETAEEKTQRLSKLLDEATKKTR